MGRQSSRLYYQGKDHKDIYFQGRYHDAMYIGSNLVWEKLDGKLEPILYEDVSVGVPEEYRKKHVKDMVSTVYGSVVFRSYYPVEYASNGSGYLLDYSSTYEFAYISGKNTAFLKMEPENVLFPDNGLYLQNAELTIGAGRLNYVYAFSGLLSYRQRFRMEEPSYLVSTMEFVSMEDGSRTEGIQFYIDGSPVERNADANACYINIGERFSQYFGGAVHADVMAGIGYPSYGICSSTDGINWTTGSKVAGVGTVIGSYLFYEDGTAINRNYEPVTYTRKPAIFVNGWYYAEELEEGYLMRSANLTNWERYKNIGVGKEFKVSGYWRTKNLLCLKKAEDDADGEAGIYKYKIHL